MAMCEMLWSYSSITKLVPSHRRESPPVVTCWFVGGEREFLGNSEFLGARNFLPFRTIQLKGTGVPVAPFKLLKILHFSRLFECEDIPAHWARQFFFVCLYLTFVPTDEALRVVAMATDGLDNISDDTFGADRAGITIFAEIPWRLDFKPVLRAGRFADCLDRHVDSRCDVSVKC